MVDLTHPRIESVRRRFAVALAVVFAALLLLPGPCAAKERERPLILLVNSYHPNSPWFIRYFKAFADEIGDAANIVIYHMDTKHVPETAFEQRAVRALELLDRTHPDVVVLGDDNAIKYIGKAVLSRGYPLVYLGVNKNPRVYIGQNSLATGVLERPLVKRSLLYLREIMGADLQRCLLILEDSATARVLSESVFNGKPSATFGGISVDMVMTNEWTKWQAEISGAKTNGYDAIMVGLYQRLRDERMNLIPGDDAIKWTSANSPLPLFGLWDQNIGPGMAVGGLVLSPIPQGWMAGRLVKDILAGDSPEDLLPVVADQGRFLFSRSGLKRWNLTLPESIERESEFVD